MVLTDYLRATRQARYSLTFALPLLLLYEGLAAAMSQSDAASVRNGADVLLKTVFMALGGRNGVTLFGVLLLGVGLWLVWRDYRKNPGRLEMSYIGLMLAESVAYAAVLGTVVSTLASLLLSGPLAIVQSGSFSQFTFGTQLMVSLGAGIYEELLFRVLLVSGMVALGLPVGLAPLCGSGGGRVGQRSHLQRVPLRGAVRRHVDGCVLHVSGRGRFGLERPVRGSWLWDRGVEPHAVRSGHCDVGVDVGGGGRRALSPTGCSIRSRLRSVNRVEDRPPSIERRDALQGPSCDEECGRAVESVLHGQSDVTRDDGAH